MHRVCFLPCEFSAGVALNLQRPAVPLVEVPLQIRRPPTQNRADLFGATTTQSVLIETVGQFHGAG